MPRLEQTLLPKLAGAWQGRVGLGVTRRVPGAERNGDELPGAREGGAQLPPAALPVGRDVWVCGREPARGSCASFRKGPEVQRAMAGIQGRAAELAGSSPNDCFPLLFSADN